MINKVHIIKSKMQAPVMLGDDFYHIYFTSDEQIKIGDCVLTREGEVKNVHYKWECDWAGTRKITHSTKQGLNEAVAYDENLIPNTYAPIPNVPDEFIAAVKALHKDNIGISFVELK